MTTPTTTTNFATDTIYSGTDVKSAAVVMTDAPKQSSGVIETPLTKPPTAKRAAQSTYDAVLWVLREYGIARLGDAWMQPRLAEFSTKQIEDLIAAMERMQPRYSRAITDELINALRGLL